MIKSYGSKVPEITFLKTKRIRIKMLNQRVIQIWHNIGLVLSPRGLLDIFNKFIPDLIIDFTRTYSIETIIDLWMISLTKTKLILEKLNKPITKIYG